MANGESDFRHGHRSTYVSGCRCCRCRGAHSSYFRRYRRNSIDKRNASARRARRHLQKLARSGIGRRCASRITGISESILRQVRTGQQRRIRPETERSILNLRKGARGGEALIPIEPTLKRIEALVDEGYSLKDLAQRLGLKKDALRLRCQRITQRRADRIEALYLAIME